jgi:phosphatidylserine/phosphatidylglycerophosphate/cardiolipin synthase-like enzyme
MSNVGRWGGPVNAARAARPRESMEPRPGLPRCLGIAASDESIALDQPTADRFVAGFSPRAEPILRPGKNCWRVAKAARAAVLVDGADYYAALEQSLRKARKSILIVGWDFDAGIRLLPDRPETPKLGDFLRGLVEEHPGLEVRVLVWSVAVLHAPGAPLPLLLGADWEKHPRIQVRLDREHPLYGAHHQKMVIIDDTLAFAGGMDLTIRRWDTCQHTAGHDLRKGPDGVPYPPVHDTQMVVEGEAALVVSDVARERWRRAIKEDVAPVQSDDDLWPESVTPDFRDTRVAVVRTLASWKGSAEVTEGMTLSLDALGAARNTIYMEAQYFTAPKIGDVLAASLARAEGPEIIAIVRRLFTSKLEKHIMGGNQARLVQRLRGCDRHSRLGVYYPVVPQGDGDCPITIHSKALIIDDDFLRIGSSNMANRSTALDTELDLAIETTDSAKQRTIAGIREKLIAEHLDCKPEDVRAAMGREGSLIRAIDKLGCKQRCLRKLPDEGKLPQGPVFGTWLLDPKRPFFLFPRKHVDASR